MLLVCLSYSGRVDETLTCTHFAGAAEYKAPLEELIRSNGGALVSLDDKCHFLVWYVISGY
jgi:glucose-6-phosphate isomerase